MRILLYGDSNTFGTAPMADLASDGTVSRRWGDVLVAEMPEHLVIVEGLPGRTTVHDDPVDGAHLNGRSVLPAILGSHRPIDLLVICLGTNDFKARFSAGPADVALSLGRLVRDARATGWVGQVLLVVPPPLQEVGPFAEIYSGAAAKSAGLAEAVVAEATREGAAMFDAGRVIATDPLDGIHWSDAAHETLGTALAAEIRALLG